MMRKKCVNIRLSVGWPLKNHLPGHWGTVHTVSFRVNVVVLRLLLEDQNPTRMQFVCEDIPEEANLFCFQHERQYYSEQLNFVVHYSWVIRTSASSEAVSFYYLACLQCILKRIKCFVHQDCLALILGTPSVSSCLCVCFSKSSEANEQLEIH